MYRIAQETASFPMDDQPCGARPNLKLQPSVLQVCISLPDRLLCRYPDTAGRIVTYRIAVYSLGDNAHGVCFLMGVGRPEYELAPVAVAGAAIAMIAAVTVVTSVTSVTAVTTVAAATDATAGPIAFRIDRVDGPVTRIDSGESLSVHMWERRVRQRFANDRQTDALPLSSILITDDARASAWQQNAG